MAPSNRFAALRSTRMGAATFQQRPAADLEIVTVDVPTSEVPGGESVPVRVTVRNQNPSSPEDGSDHQGFVVVESPDLPLPVLWTCFSISPEGELTVDDSTIDGTLDGRFEMPTDTDVELQVRAGGFAEGDDCSQALSVGSVTDEQTATVVLPEITGQGWVISNAELHQSTYTVGQDVLISLVFKNDTASERRVDMDVYADDELVRAYPNFHFTAGEVIETNLRWETRGNLFAEPGSPGVYDMTVNIGGTVAEAGTLVLNPGVDIPEAEVIDCSVGPPQILDGEEVTMTATVQNLEAVPIVAAVGWRSDPGGFAGGAPEQRIPADSVAEFEDSFELSADLPLGADSVTYDWIPSVTPRFPS